MMTSPLCLDFSRRLNRPSFQVELRSAIEECYAVENDIPEIQKEIETKLWKSVVWNYFMKPAPGTTEEEAADEKNTIKKIFKMWLGIPAICLVLGILFMMVDLAFTRGLGGLLLIIGGVELYANVIILPAQTFDNMSIQVKLIVEFWDTL